MGKSAFSPSLVPLELAPLVGTPPWCGPLPLDFLENPHFPRGYRVVSKSNSPTRYIAEWVNKSKFILTKLCDQVKKRSFLVEMIYDWIGWNSCTETSPKRTRLQQKIMIFVWKTGDFPLGHRKPHSPSAQWSHRGKFSAKPQQESKHRKMGFSKIFSLFFLRKSVWKGCRSIF